MNDVEIMNAAFGASVSFGSIDRSKCIGHTTFSFRSSSFHSKSTPIHGPVHRSEYIFSYFRIYFSWLPQAVPRIIINIFSHKVSYTFMMIDPLINVFIPNEVRSYFQILDHLIITLEIGVRMLQKHVLVVYISYIHVY